MSSILISVSKITFTYVFGLFVYFISVLSRILNWNKFKFVNDKKTISFSKTSSLYPQSFCLFVRISESAHALIRLQMQLNLKLKA